MSFPLPALSRCPPRRANNVLDSGATNRNEITRSCAADQLSARAAVASRAAIAASRWSSSLARSTTGTSNLAIDRDGADTFGQCLVIGGDDAPSMVDLVGARPELLVQDRHLARMDHRSADKTESTRTPDRLPKAVEIVELSNRADKAQWHDSGGASGEHGHLLWHR